MDENKTMLGLKENIECMLCYALGWISGIVFLILEKENKLVKFHALQSIIIFLSVSIAVIVIGIIPLIRNIVNPILGIAAFILWIVLMVKTYQGEKFVVPFAGEMAERIAE